MSESYIERDRMLKWFDGEGNDVLSHWLCRECGLAIGLSGKLLKALDKFVAVDQDERPICLCFRCWNSPAQRAVSSEGFLGTIREYHEHQSHSGPVDKS